MVDAITYLHKREYMCKTLHNCRECPLTEDGYGCLEIGKEKPELAVERVMLWSVNHDNKS